MITIHFSGAFKKDLKRFKNDKEKIDKIYKIIKILEKEGSVPKMFLPHKLKGKYKGCTECHIENDLLLIWIDLKKNVIEVLRLGSHAELFKI